jgi:(p)ppGpp synthase/HD superfamily hydrolase
VFLTKNQWRTLMTAITRRFTDAVEYARIAHAAQVRKGSNIPYLYHLLGVASLVLEHDGSEDQAIAALLHDVLEDCGAGHEPVIRAQFGDIVADIVLACTDGTHETKGSVAPQDKAANWRQRKLAYIAALETKPDHALLVSGCDKLHNARAIVGDLERPTVGRAVFDRFTGGRDGTLGYYAALSQVMRRRDAKVAGALEAEVARMHRLAGAEAQEVLA